MTDGRIYQGGWSLNEVAWDEFDASKVDTRLLAAVKAASLVEYNAPDYVTYLSRVFRDGPTQTLNDLERWGQEEIQHGLALGRWAEMADPTFNFKDAFARFRAGYRPAHFTSEDAVSVRGSRRGEMIARCVVECGTSSYYSAIRDATDEPVLKEIAGRIAADEFRHYRLFLETLNAQTEADLPVWRKLYLAFTRVQESDDDELAYAYYCANVASTDVRHTPYNRLRYARAYNATAMTLYRRHHIKKLVQMVAKACGLGAQSWLTNIASAALWQVLRLRAGNRALGNA
jgi:rubrerythrin